MVLALVVVLARFCLFLILLKQLTLPETGLHVWCLSHQDIPANSLAAPHTKDLEKLRQATMASGRRSAVSLPSLGPLVPLPLQSGGVGFWKEEALWGEKLHIEVWAPEDSTLDV